MEIDSGKCVLHPTTPQVEHEDVSLRRYIQGFFSITTIESAKCMREPDLNLLIISEILSHKNYNQMLHHEFHHTDKQ